MSESIKQELKEDYCSLLNSGMFWEFYPELSGDYDKDFQQFIKNKMKEIQFRASIGKALNKDSGNIEQLKLCLMNVL